MAERVVIIDHGRVIADDTAGALKQRQAGDRLTLVIRPEHADIARSMLVTEGSELAESIGPWFGSGPERAMALIFMVFGVLGLIVTLLALRSRYYRVLSDAYGAPPPDDDQKAQPQPAAV